MKHLTLVWFLALSLIACGGAGATQYLDSADQQAHANAGPLPEGLFGSFEELEKAPPLHPVPQCKAKTPKARPAKARFIVQDVPGEMAKLMALSGDGRVFAAITSDDVLRVWDTRTGLLLQRRKVGGGAQNISLSHDGGVVIYWDIDLETAAMKTWVLDNASGRPPRAMSAVAAGAKVSPDGKQVAIPLKNVDMHSAKTGARIRSIPLPKDINYAARLQYDASGKRMAVAGMKGDLLVIDVKSGKIKRLGSHTGGTPPMSIAWAGDHIAVIGMQGSVLVDSRTGKAHKLHGKTTRAASLGDRIIYVPLSVGQKGPVLEGWNGKSGGKVAVRIAEHRRVGNLASSADGSTFAIAVSDWTTKRHGMVIYDARTMRPIRTFDGERVGVTAVAVSRDGNTMLTGGRLGQMQRWSLATGKLERSSTATEQQQVKHLSFDPTGRYVAYSAGSYFVRIKDVRTGLSVRQWDAGKTHLAMARYMPDGKRIITAGYDGAVRIWKVGNSHPASPTRAHMRFVDVAKPALREVGRVGFEVHRAALSRGGHLLALDGKGGELAVMDLRTGKLRFQSKAATRSGYQYMTRRWLAFAKGDKTLLVAGVDLAKGPDRPVVIERDTLRGAVKKTHRVGTAGPMLVIGDRLLIGGSHPAILSTATLQKRASIEVSDPTVISVAYNKKRDQFFLGGSAGSTTVVTAQGKVTALLISTPEGEYIAATPEGAFLASLDGARRIAWIFGSPVEGYSFEQFAKQYRRPDYVAKRLSGKPVTKLQLPSRPPRVSMVGKRPAGSIAKDSVSLSAAVRSGQRVDRVRAYVNGRPAVDELVCQQSKGVKLDVPLVAGRNRISLVAYDGAGYASHPAVVDIVSTAASAKKPDMWIVTLGVSRYPNLSPKHQLEYADDDARDIAAMFAVQASKASFNKVHSITLLNEQVTPDTVERAMLSLSRMKPEDFAVVFMAGHGVKLGGEGMVFLTHGASLTNEGAKKHGVGWHHIQRALERARGRVLLLLDACHSGHMSTDTIALNDELAGQLAAGDRSGVLVFAASRGAQLSYEVGSSSNSRGLYLVDDTAGSKTLQAQGALRGGHGLFTSAVLAVLDGGGADRDRSGAIELGEFIDSVTERVRSASDGLQTPWVARRELFGDFVIAPAR